MVLCLYSWFDLVWMDELLLTQIYLYLRFCFVFVFVCNSLYIVDCTSCKWMSCYWYVFPCHGHNADSASPPDGFAIKSGFSEFAKWISRTLLNVESTFLKIHIFAQPSIFVPFKESAKPAQRVQDPQLDVPDSALLKKTWTKYFPYFVNFLFWGYFAEQIFAILF